MSAVRLGDHAKLIRGITFKPVDKCDPRDEGAVVCMRTKNVQATLDASDLIAVPSSLSKNPEKMLSAGDILVSSANSWNLVGKCCQVPRLQYPSTAGGFISILRPKTEKLESSYLYRWFSSDVVQRKLRSFANQTTNISNLDHKRTLELQIPLPPLAEQKRIAGILDAADALRAKRREALAQLDTLLQSTFLDMFGDPVTNPMGWEVVHYGQIDSNAGLTSNSLQGNRILTSGDHARGGLSHVPNAKDGDTFISSSRIQNLKDGQLDLGDIAFVEAPESAEAKRTTVEPGDVLLSITADLGRTAVVPRGIAKAHINQHLAILRFTSLNPVFVSYQLASKGGQAQFDRLNREGVKAGLNFNDVKSIRLTNPPLNLQQRFAAIADSVEHQKASHRAHYRTTESPPNSTPSSPPCNPAPSGETSEPPWKSPPTSRS